MRFGAKVSAIELNGDKVIVAYEDGTGLHSLTTDFCISTIPMPIFKDLTTNLSAPFSDWTVLGGVTEFAPGLYQFTDANASNYPQRYYRVRYP